MKQSFKLSILLTVTACAGLAPAAVTSPSELLHVSRAKALTGAAVAALGGILVQAGLNGHASKSARSPLIAYRASRSSVQHVIDFLNGVADKDQYRAMWAAFKAANQRPATTKSIRDLAAQGPTTTKNIKELTAGEPALKRMKAFATAHKAISAGLTLGALAVAGHIADTLHANAAFKKLAPVQPAPGVLPEPAPAPAPEPTPAKATYKVKLTNKRTSSSKQEVTVKNVQQNISYPYTGYFHITGTPDTKVYYRGQTKKGNNNYFTELVNVATVLP